MPAIALLTAQTGTTPPVYTDVVTTTGSAQLTSGTAGAAAGGQIVFTTADIGLAVSDSGGQIPASTVIQSMNFTASDGITHGTNLFDTTTTLWTQNDVNKAFICASFPAGTYIKTVNSTTNIKLSSVATTNTTLVPYTVIRGGQYCTLSKNATGATTALTITNRTNPIDLTGAIESTAGVQAWIDAQPDGSLLYIPKYSSGTTPTRIWIEGTLLLSNRQLLFDGCPINSTIIGNNTYNNIATVAVTPAAPATTITAGGAGTVGNLIATGEHFTFSDINRVIYDAGGANLVASAFTDGATDGSDILTSPAQTTFTSTDLGCQVIPNNATNNLNTITPWSIIIAIVDTHHAQLNQASPAGLITTIPQASNGTALSAIAGVLNVTSAVGFPSPTGTVVFSTTTGYAAVSYTSTSTAAFSGCSVVYGTGNLIAGNTVSAANQSFVVGRNVISSVQGPQAITVTASTGATPHSATSTIGLTILNRLQPAGGATFFQLTDGSTAALPQSIHWPAIPLTPSITTPLTGGFGTLVGTFTGSGTLTVTNTTNFPVSGVVTVTTSVGLAQITYTGGGGGGTSLTGCNTINGSGALVNAAGYLTVTACMLVYQGGASTVNDFSSGWPVKRSSFNIFDGAVNFRNMQTDGYSGNDFHYDGQINNGSSTLNSVTAAFTAAVNGCQVVAVGIPAGAYATYSSPTAITLATSGGSPLTYTLPSVVLDSGLCGIMFTLINRNPVGDLGAGITASPYALTSSQYGIYYQGASGYLNNVRSVNSWVEAFAVGPAFTGNLRPADRAGHDVTARNCYFGGTQRFVTQYACAFRVYTLQCTIEAGKTGGTDIEPDAAILNSGDINIINCIYGSHGASGVISFGGSGEDNICRVVGNVMLTDIHMNIGTSFGGQPRSVVDIAGNIALKQANSTQTISINGACLLRVQGNIIPIKASTNANPTGATTTTVSGSPIIVFGPAETPPRAYIGSLITGAGIPSSPATIILDIAPGNIVTLNNNCTASSTTTVATIHIQFSAISDTGPIVPGTASIYTNHMIGPGQIVAW